MVSLQGSIRVLERGLGVQGKLRPPPKGPLIEPLWPLLVDIWDILEGSWRGGGV